jgi:hypothetical protein
MAHLERLYDRQLLDEKELDTLLSLRQNDNSGIVAAFGVYAENKDEGDLLHSLQLILRVVEEDKQLEVCFCLSVCLSVCLSSGFLLSLSLFLFFL